MCHHSISTNAYPNSVLFACFIRYLRCVQKSQGLSYIIYTIFLNHASSHARAGYLCVARARIACNAREETLPNPFKTLMSAHNESASAFVQMAMSRRVVYAEDALAWFNHIEEMNDRPPCSSVDDLCHRIRAHRAALSKYRFQGGFCSTVCLFGCKSIMVVGRLTLPICLTSCLRAPPKRPPNAKQRK